MLDCLWYHSFERMYYLSRKRSKIRGSNECVIPPGVAEKCALMGIWKVRATSPVKLQVALQEYSETESFLLSRSWKALRIVLHLSSGNLALKYYIFDCPERPNERGIADWFICAPKSQGWHTHSVGSKPILALWNRLHLRTELWHCKNWICRPTYALNI